MLLPIMGPPPLTGDDKKDIENLHRYTTDTVSRLMLILRNIDGDNLTTVPSNRLTGAIPEELMSPTETAEVYTMSLREENIDVTDTEETDAI